MIANSFNNKIRMPINIVKMESYCCNFFSYSEKWMVSKTYLGLSQQTNCQGQHYEIILVLDTKESLLPMRCSPSFDPIHYNADGCSGTVYDC